MNQTISPQLSEVYGCGPILGLGWEQSPRRESPTSTTPGSSLGVLRQTLAILIHDTKSKTKMKDKPLLITTARRGVFFGYGQPTKESTITLRNARMCVYWSAELRGVLGLATAGPNKNCKVGPSVNEITLRDVTSISLCSAEAVEQWEKGSWS